MEITSSHTHTHTLVLHTGDFHVNSCVKMTSKQCMPLAFLLNNNRIVSKFKMDAIEIVSNENVNHWISSYDWFPQKKLFFEIVQDKCKWIQWDYVKSMHQFTVESCHKRMCYLMYFVLWVAMGLQHFTYSVFRECFERVKWHKNAQK